MYRKILVPLDGSDVAALALPPARAFARAFGATVLLLEVVPTGGAALALATDVASGAMTDPAAITGDVAVREQAAEGYVAAVAQELAAEGIDAAYAVGRGDESGGIIEASDREAVDLIIMATHQRGAIGRLFRGSVADDVVRRARMPVLIIPPVRDLAEDE